MQPGCFSEHVSLGEEGSRISASMAKRNSRAGSKSQTDALGDTAQLLASSRAHLQGVGVPSVRPPWPGHSQLRCFS